MKILTIFLTIILFVEAYSQNQSAFKQDANLNVSSLLLPSPNSLSATNNANIQANQYTGTPNISIPLYSFDLCGKSIPIELEYTMSGLRPLEEASWVGLGWIITGFPTISRQIKDMDDFYIDQSTVANPVKLGFFYYNSLIIQANCIPSWLVNSHVENFFDYHYYSTDKDKYDLEPDEFSVNLFGENIKFYLGNYSTPNDEVLCTVVSGKNYKVTISENTKNIKIIDPDGFIYYFNQKELTDTYGSQAYFVNQISSWFITKIESPSEQNITFDYSSNGRTISPTYENHRKNFVFDSYHYRGPLLWTGQAVVPYDSWSENDEVLLSSIKSVGEELIFQTSSRDDLNGENGYHSRKLDKILIKYNYPDVGGAPVVNNVVKKEINFNYGYFREDKSGVSSPWLWKRLKLNSVSVVDKKFYFEYDNSQQLPIKTTYNIDMWGYYNSANNTYLTPRVNYYGHISYGANREADPNYSISGQLVAITYPTGGKTELSYEGHEVKLPDSYDEGWENNKNLSLGNFRNKIVGGLRLNEIKVRDINGQIVSRKEFKYNELNSLVSSGLLMDENPLYYTVSGAKAFDHYGGYDAHYSQQSYITIEGSHLSSLLNSAKGSHVGYSFVTEKFINDSDPNSLKQFFIKRTFQNNQNIRSGPVSTRYEDNFFSWQNFVGTSPPSLPPGYSFRSFLTFDYRGLAFPVMNSSDYKNGSLLKEEWYDINNSLIKEVNYSYQDATNNQVVVHGVRHTIGNTSPIWGVPGPSGTVLDSYVNYCRRQKKYLLTEVNTIDYLDNGSIANSIIYRYNNDWQINEIEKNLSNGDLKQDFLYFTKDYSNSINSINSLVLKNQLNVPIKTESLINGNLIAGVINEYNVEGSIYRSYQYESNTLSPPITHSSSTLINNSNYKLQATYDYHDINQPNGSGSQSCKLKEVIDEHGMPVTLIWGYSQLYIVAKIYGLAYNDVMNLYSINQNILDNEDNETMREQELNNLRTSIENAGYFIETFRFDPLIGLIEQKSNQSIKTSYKYYPNGKLKGILNTDSKMIKAYEYGFFNRQ